MTMLILATDMARHGEIVELFKAYCEGSEDFDLSNKEHFDSVWWFYDTWIVLMVWKSDSAA